MSLPSDNIKIKETKCAFKMHILLPKYQLYYY